MDRGEGHDMLAAGALMTVASAVRAGTGCLELWSQRMPTLTRMAAEVDEHPDRSQTERAALEGRMRDELLAVARDSAEIVMRELRRGLEDLDSYTRGEVPPADAPQRPYRAKR